MSDEIVLYDLPSKDPCKCWSLNPWKTRLVLNYKSLPYTTQWTEYPDLAPLFTSLSVPPNNLDGVPPYTSPCIKLPFSTGGSQCIQESYAIAQALESAHPSPSLHLDSPYLKQVMDILPKAAMVLRPIYLPLVPRMLLNERSKKYFEETRAKRVGEFPYAVGMELPDYERSAEGGQKAYDAAAESLGAIVGLLQEKKEGPFFEGEEVSYADFVFVGFLRFMERLDVLWNVLDACEAGKEGGRKSAEEVYFACGKWLERDDR